MTNLHDELVRIAERAPDVDTAGAWEAGRRARSRDRVIGGIVVAAVLAVVAGLGSLLVSPDRTVAPVSPGPDGGAVPSQVWSVPEGLVHHPEDPDALPRWDPEVAETDLAIGQGAVAFTVGPLETYPVVVTSGDGAYHPLVLPGWIGSGMVNSLSDEAAQLALSPDGRSLAYAWWDPAAPLDRPMPAGVRIVDLASGDVRTIALRGGNGVLVTSLVWSPDSRWLGWGGIRTRSWTPSSMSGGPAVGGVIGPRATRSLPVDGGRVVALADDGKVTMTGRNGRIALGDGSRLPGELLSSTGMTAAPAPSGSVVALGQLMPEPTVSFIARDTIRVDRFPLDPEAYPDGALARPLGWVDDSHVVMLLTPAFDVRPNAGWSSRGHELVVVDSVDGSVSVVGEVEMGASDSFTVATDLMTLERPTVERPEPEWPGVDAPDPWLLAVAGGTALGLALAAYVVWRRRRAR